MNESYSYLIKFLFMFLAILALIFILSLLTPKMAAFVDKVIAKLFKESKGWTMIYIRSGAYTMLRRRTKRMKKILII